MAGELHPFKQYLGSKARFADAAGAVQELQCYIHHLTDYSKAARWAGLAVEDLRECFDEDEREAVSRIVSWLFRRE